MKKVLWVTPFLIAAWVTPALANVEQIKIYKGAFPDSKPKCLFCHVDAVPKKDDGKHEPNAYGQAVLKLNPKPTADTYQQAGPAEDFKE
ncbi:MAG: hypothetical protein Q8Q08_10320 [Candidatus Omnitrophota bacterium]|nr:hypothetical protein [Candidatus Omnitrophota bacterium]